jgi:PAS domain S-box-containing protein
VWVHLTLSLVQKPDGSPDYLIAVVKDIGERKKTEQALRTSEHLLRQAQKLAGLATWQADVATRRFTFLSDSQDILGVDDNEFSDGALLAHTHPDDVPAILRQWALAVKGQAIYNVEHRLTLSGDERWFSVQAEFERDAQGRALRALGVSQDITARKRAELEIQRLNASLEQRIQLRTQALRGAYNELESYSYAVAHDLRSPLRIINGFAQALQEDNPALDASSQQHLQRIMAASKKMGELIDGLLQLSQVGRGALQRSPVDLSAMARRLLEEQMAHEPGRRVDWSVDDGLHAQADPPLAEALLQNLLHNAWKYTAQTAAARIRVFAREHDGQTWFCVQDNGAGFDMARADKLFKPFQRLHTAAEFSGLGIGLATALRIVQRHGGLFEAEGEPGAGATFAFTLPPGEEDAAADPTGN